MADKRVVFTFDEGSYEYLKDLADDEYSGSVVEALRASLAIRKALLSQADQGFSEVIVRNPNSGRERVMVPVAAD